MVKIKTLSASCNWLAMANRTHYAIHDDMEGLAPYYVGYLGIPVAYFYNFYDAKTYLNELISGRFVNYKAETMDKDND